MTLRLVYDSAYLSLFPKLTAVLRNAVYCLLSPRQVTVSRGHWVTVPSTQTSTGGFHVILGSGVCLF